jgi:hypothetical protein
MSLDLDPVDFLLLRFFKLYSMKDDVTFNPLNKDKNYVLLMFFFIRRRIAG